MFSLPEDHSQLQSFIDKYNKNQEQLQTLAAVDDLLSGNLIACDDFVTELVWVFIIS